MTSKSLYSLEWPLPHNVEAIQTTRQEGASTDAFASFNLGDHVNDDPSLVASNRKKLQSELALAAQPRWMSQVHGCDVIEMTPENTNQYFVADASFTRCKHMPLAIMTADCLPILLSDEKGTVVAAIHGGWRSLAANIIGKVISAMDVDSSTLMAWLGVSICDDCFEVGDDVKVEFEALSSQFSSAFKKNRNQKWQADLKAIAAVQLNHAGVEHIYSDDACSACDSDNFYSYRRDGETGRMASLIWIK